MIIKEMSFLICFFWLVCFKVIFVFVRFNIFLFYYFEEIGEWLEEIGSLFICIFCCYSYLIGYDNFEFGGC